ncbi:MAG TPA: M14 family zinc carboxypeptidase, partial [Gemmatirosa sp.]
MRLLPGPLAAALLLAVSAVPAAAQPLLPAARDTAARDDRRFEFTARGPYRPDVPRPEALLGYPLGARNTQYGEQERVLLAIAGAARDRVRVEELGASHEGRRMRLFVVSAPENVARLDAIRADLGRLADPRTLATGTAGTGEAEAIARRTPAVVWISESVHGNESPGFESGMQLLYQLAASTEPATLAALRNTVVVINPSSNPDGHERFAVWYNSVGRSDPANDAYEHREPWSIQGRFNHYRFDMNRDVIASTQPEVQAIMAGMLRWHPQVTVDQHGQVPTYFFPPAARPVNANIGPESDKWLAAIGRANAAAFDAQGWQYFVRNEFDLYYPGYWDTWPSLNGATGMTYETDGGGWKGTLWRRDDGSLLSFRDGIAKHWTTAMATIEATAARAAERLVDYGTFRRRAVELGRSGRMREVVLVPGADPQRAAELAAALVRAGIEVRQTNVAVSSARAHAYGAGSAVESPNAAGTTRHFEPGAYVVDLAQPQGRLARAVLEPAPALDSTFARRQVERFQRNLRRGANAGGEEAEFYDITAWSLPVAFGVEAYWTEDASSGGGGRLLALPNGATPGTASAAAALPGPPVAPAPATGGTEYA